MRKPKYKIHDKVYVVTITRFEQEYCRKLIAGSVDGIFLSKNNVIMYSVNCGFSVVNYQEKDVYTDHAEAIADLW